MEERPETLGRTDGPDLEGYPLRDEATEPLPPPTPVPAGLPPEPILPRRRRPPIGNPWPWLIAVILVLGGLGAAYAATRSSGQSTAPPPAAAAAPPPAPAPAPPAAPPPPPPPASTKTQPPSPPPPTTVSVPSLVGTTLPHAIASLKQAGLTAVVAHVVSNAPEGQVVGQNPRSATSVPKGGRVRLNVSVQPLISVPNVIGMQGLQAVHTLQADHLTSTLRYVPSTLPARQVISQFPPAGRSVKRGTSILLNLSQGNRPKGSSGPTGPTGSSG